MKTRRQMQPCDSSAHRFAHHLSDVECIGLIRVFWDLAKIVLPAGERMAKERHLIVYMIVQCGLQSFAMLCICT